MKLIRIFAFSLVLGLAALATPLVANAGDAQIEAAMDRGTVGERIDGYLGVVDPSAVDPAVNRKVQEINNKRRALYTQLAEETKTTVAQVARVTGEKQVVKAQAAGRYYLDDSGKWKK